MPEYYPEASELLAQPELALLPHHDWIAICPGNDIPCWARQVKQHI